MKSIKDFIGGTILLILIVLYIFGAFIGAVYWAFQESLINVVLSIFVPLYGAITLIIEFVRFIFS